MATRLRLSTDDVSEVKGRQSMAALLRSGHEASWEANERLFMPFRGEVYTERRAGDSRVGSMVDGTGARSSDKFQSFIRANTFPPDSDWVFLNPSFDFREDQRVHDALWATAQRLLLAFQDSNFYQAAGTSIRDQSVFGNGPFLTQLDKPIVSENDPENTFGGFLFESVPIWRVWIIEGAGGRIIGVFREFEMPAIDAYRWFDRKPGQAAMEELEENGRSLEKVKYMQYVFPREKSIPGALDHETDAPWVSWIFCTGNGEWEPIQEEGMLSNPYVVPRMGVPDRAGPYGYGPGAFARPDAMGTNELKAQILIAAGRDMNPPTIVEARSTLNMDLGPNGRIVMKGPKRLAPQPYVTGSRYDVAEALRLQYTTDVRKTFMADLLEQPDSQPRSAEESFRLRQMALLNLAAPAQAIITEFLNPVIETCILLMESKGALPELTALSQELGPVAFTPRYQSPLFTAQNKPKVDEVRESLLFRVQMQQGSEDQSWLDGLDPDGYDRYEKAALALPADVSRSEEEIEEIRAARAQQDAQESGLAAAEQISNISRNVEGAA